MMMDFIRSNSRDPFHFVKYSKSYYNFITKVDSDFRASLSKEQEELLTLFSLEINNGKRIEESIVLRQLLRSEKLKIEELKRIISEDYGYKVSEETIASVVSNLNFLFVKNARNIVIIEEGWISRHSDFSLLLKNDTFRQFLRDTVAYSIHKFTSKYSTKAFTGGFILYEKYSRKDVCRILNWDKDLSSTVYGYKTYKNSTPCFVTYHKSEDINDTIKFKDEFITPSEFAWESTGNRKISSPDVQKLINSNRILLFIKKEDAEGTDFYYMGDVSIIPNSITQSNQDSGNPIVHFRFKLDNQVQKTSTVTLLTEIKRVSQNP